MGTPSQRQLSMWKRAAAYVSVLDVGLTSFSPR